VTQAPLALTLPIAVVLALPAAAAAVAAVGGWTGRLTRSSRLGVHTLAASASNRGFAVANRVAAPVVAGAAAIGLVTALIVLILPVDVPTAIIIGVLGLAGTFVLLYVAAAMGEQAARSVPLPARKPGTAGGWSCTAGLADTASVSGAGSTPDTPACGRACDTCSGAADCQIAAMAPAATPTRPSRSADELPRTSRVTE
jgi:hypothetical protein